MKSITKITLNFLFVSILLCSCNATKLYEQAKNSESIPKYEKFVAEHSKSKHFPQAVKELEKLQEEFDWKISKMTNSISSYQNFISQYPKSQHNKNANIKIAELKELTLWEKAKDLNTIEQYEYFKSEYPNSSRIKDANRYISEITDNKTWEEAEESEDIGQLRNYLSNYPNGINKEAAIAKIFELEFIRPYWLTIKDTKNPSELLSFINKHPNSAYSELAQHKLTELEKYFWNNAVKKNSIASFEYYIKHFPNGKNNKNARKKIIDLEVTEIFNGDHGYLPPMNKSSKTNYYSTINEIEIYNNTQYELTVRYSGNESVKVILSPKEKTKVKIANGDYRVTASVNANHVRNYAGKDELEGSKYESEFYIETKFF